MGLLLCAMLGATVTSMDAALNKGVGVFVRSFYILSSIDPGFRQDGVLVAFISFDKLHLARSRYSSMSEDLLKLVRSIPRVDSAATSTHIPFNGSWTSAVDVDGAGAALGDAASVLGAGQTRLLAQGPKEGCIAVDVQVDGLAIHVEFGHVEILRSGLAHRHAKNASCNHLAQDYGKSRPCGRDRFSHLRAQTGCAAVQRGRIGESADSAAGGARPTADVSVSAQAAEPAWAVWRTGRRR